MSKFGIKCGNCANVKREWSMEYIGNIRCTVTCEPYDSIMFCYDYRTYKFLREYPNYQPFVVLIDNREGCCQHHTPKIGNSKP